MKKVLSLVIVIAMIAALFVVPSAAAKVGWFYNFGEQICAPAGGTAVNNGTYVTFTDTTGDGNIYMGPSAGNFAAGVVAPAINCDLLKHWVVKLRVKTGLDNGDLRTEIYNFNGSAHGSAGVHLDRTTTDWQYAYLDLTTVAAWNTTNVTWFRVDPFNVNGASGDVDWVAGFESKADADAFIADEKANGTAAFPIPEYVNLSIANADDKGDPGNSIQLDPNSEIGFRINLGKGLKNLSFLQWTPGATKGHFQYDFIVYKWNTDYLTSVAGTPVFKESVTTPGDGLQSFSFEDSVPAGEYLFLIDATGRFVDEGSSTELGGVIMHIQTGGWIDGYKDDYIETYYSNAFGTPSGLERLPLMTLTLYNDTGDDLIKLEEAPSIVPNIGILPGSTIFFDVNGSQGATDFKNNSDVYGIQFSIAADADFVAIECPSWGNNVGNLIFNLYKFDTSYLKSLEGEAIASYEFVNYADNATLGFKFNKGALTAGEYVLVVSTNTAGDGVGFWNMTGYPGQNVFLNGELVPNLSTRMYVHFVDAVEGNPYGTLTPPQVVLSYSDLSWTIPEGGGKFTIGEEFLQCPEFYNHVWLDSDFVMDGSTDFTIELALDIVSISKNEDVINKDYISAAFLFNRNDKAGLEIHPNTQGKAYIRIDGTRKDVSETAIPVGTALTVKIEYDKDEATLTYYINDQVAGTTDYDPNVHNGTFSIRGAWLSYKVTKVTYLDHIEPSAAEILANAKTAALAELENVYNAKIAALTNDNAKATAKAAYDAAVAAVNAAADVDAVNTAATNGKAAINDVVDPAPTADVFTFVVLAAVVMMGVAIVLKRKVNA